MALVRVRRALVVGCGEFGLAVANRLSDAGYAVIVVDKDAAAFNGLSAGFGGETVVADGADAAVLADCDIEQTDTFVACTERDTVNYFLGRIASEVYGVEHVFARIEDEDLIGLLDESTVEPICPHRLCLDAFCRTAHIA